MLMPFMAVTSDFSGLHVDAYILGYQIMVNKVAILTYVSGLSLLRIFLILICILSVIHIVVLLVIPDQKVYMAGLGVTSIQFVMTVALFVRLYIIGHSATDSIMAVLIARNMIKMPALGMYVLSVIMLLMLAGNVYGMVTGGEEGKENLDVYSGNSIILSKKSEAIGKLVGRTGAYAGISVTFEDGEQVTIGRDPELSHIVLDSPTISKVHCYIQMKPEIHGYSIMDRSLNGTYMGDGSRLPKGIYVDVPGGSILYIGSVDNTFALASYE